MQLTQWLYPDAPARCYIDGKRVSRSRFDFVRDSAARLDCFHTRCWPVEGGFKRVNYSHATMKGA